MHARALLDQTFITPVQAGHIAFGWAPQTCYNKINEDKKTKNKKNKAFPFPLYPVGNRKMVKTSDLAKFEAEIKPITQAENKTEKKRGAPKKADRIKALAAQGKGGAAC